MKHKNKLAALLTGTALLFALTACDNSTEGTTSDSTGEVEGTSDSQGTEQQPTGEQSTSVSIEAKTEYDLEAMTDIILETAGLAGTTVVATAGEHNITALEVLSLTLSQLDELSSYAMYGLGDVPWGEDLGDGEIFEDYMLRTSVELATLYRIIPTEVAAEGVSLPEGYYAEAEAGLDSIKADTGNSELNYNLALWQVCTTEEMYLQNSEAYNLFIELFDQFYGENGSKVPTDEASILAEMEAQGVYHTKHILISTLDDAGEEISNKSEALSRAEDILDTLKGSSNLEEDFHEMMLELSEDPGSTSSPEGYATTLGMMVEPYETASLALEIGEMSGIVESSFGYHIILRLPLVPDSSYLSEMINEMALELQDSWLAKYPIETKDIFNDIDLKLFYDNLDVFRAQSSAFMSEETTETGE